MLQSDPKNTRPEDSQVADLPDEINRRFEEILDNMAHTPSGRDREELTRAFHFAAAAHSGQSRVSGDPYIIHPLEVMGILSQLNVDSVTLIGALLHDVIEDTGVEMNDVAREFGPVVGLLVEGMTKLAALRYDAKSNEERQAEYFRKMLLSMAQDLRVIMIKLADRLHNMRTLEVLPEKSQKRIAQESLEIYAPLAHRFGIGKIKMELEDLSLKVLDNTAYRRIAERVSMRREEREEAIARFIEPLKRRLSGEGIEAQIYGRAKHFYSIYNKIRKRGKSFEEILDLLAVRIVVNNLAECYRTLGVVHSLYKPILERFADYIAMPKANMYQSLHTKVIDEEGRVVEVQIRTQEMDLVAEVGIAAHWQYKEDGKGKDQAEQLRDYYKWLRQLIEGIKEDDTSEELMQTLKINLFTDEVFVFTPRGKLIQLPKGSTPVDFAFAVHTDIGLTTLGAKVNGRMVSLEYTLKNGDTVEILTSSNARPSVSWLKFTNTHRARSKIRRFFKQQHWEESIRLGEEMLKREFARSRQKVSHDQISEMVEKLGFQNLETLYAAIGDGDLSAQSVVDRYLQANQREKGRKESDLTRFLGGSRKVEGGVRVKGESNVMIQYGSCCNPLPGDRIIGYISKGRGIIVHRLDCPNIAELSKEKDRLVDVEWDASAEDRFNARLRIYTEDRPQLLRDIAEVLSKQGVNVIEMNLRTEGAIGVGTLVVHVKSLSHLFRVRNRIGRVKGVVQVERVGVADVA